MIYDLLYNGVLLSSVYLGFDLLNEYKKEQLKTSEDLKIYFALKGIKLLKLYNYTARNITSVINRCKLKEEEIEENDNYKIVVLRNDGEVSKSLLCFEGESDFYIENYEDLEECLENNEAKYIYISKEDDENFLQINPDELKEDETILQLKEKLENIVNKKLFLNVQLIINNEEYDLNNIISKYCIVGNDILCIDFLKYILLDNLDLVLENEDYKINIIDKNIVMFDMDKNNYIRITKEGYKIV
jgi:hypothetical protein